MEFDTLSDLPPFVSSEALTAAILGVKPRGNPAIDPPFDHHTGVGWVAAKAGAYHDALTVKHSAVCPLLHEVLGGLAPRAFRHLRFLARRARDKKRGRDGTRYSAYRRSSFLAHHLASISSAIVFADAKAILSGAKSLQLAP